MNRAELIAAAEESQKEYPQYRGRFDRMRRAVGRRTVKTKLGVAVAKGDEVLFERDALISPGYVLLWSFRNGCLTSVPASAIEPDDDALDIDITEPMQLAEGHLAVGESPALAVLAFDDAAKYLRAGAAFFAWQRTVDSIRYSVGVEHVDYKRVFDHVVALRAARVSA